MVRDPGIGPPADVLVPAEAADDTADVFFPAEAACGPADVLLTVEAPA